MDPDRRGALETLLRLLASSLLEAAPSARAGLAREYRATLAELSSLTVAEADPIDDLAAQRARRRADAKVS